MKHSKRIWPLMHASAVTVLFSLSACLHDDPRETYREVGNAMYALLSNPTSFCGYVGANMSAISSSEFDSCALSLANSLQAQLNAIQDDCDAIFIDGYDLLKCDQERGAQEIQFGLAVLNEFTGLSDGTESCSDLSAVISTAVSAYDEAVNEINLFNQDQEPLPSWNELITDRRSNIIDQYTCEL